MNKLKKIKWKDTIDLLATTPSISTKELSEKTGMPTRTITLWRSNPEFIEACYDKFMEISGVYLPQILLAMIREAMEGNVRAAELVLKHYG